MQRVRVPDLHVFLMVILLYFAGGFARPIMVDLL